MLCQGFSNLKARPIGFQRSGPIPQHHQCITNLVAAHRENALPLHVRRIALR